MNSNSHASCKICGETALQEFIKFRDLKRVTSDSRPWGAGGKLLICLECGTIQKSAEAVWLNEISQIYESYAIYHQSGGREQPIFSRQGTLPQPRSRSLITYLDSKTCISPDASVLDFGCGTGAALKTYSECHPGWKLYGAELSSRNSALLRTIPGFTELFTCPPGDIPGCFEIITLIHSLEHVIEPVRLLQELATKLKDGGVLFIQVPNSDETPYDLVIADHIMHFTLSTLRFAARQAGLDVAESTDGVLPKELSLIARSNGVPSARDFRVEPGAAVARVDAQLGWLSTQMASATSIALESLNFGIFGTSISATWLAGPLLDRVSFFVDEDPDRIGRMHLERPILSPEQIAPDADVFVPLVTEIAESVVSRLSRSGIRFYVPPPLS
jgi:SAM-dependent methyltransferase